MTSRRRRRFGAGSRGSDLFSTAKRSAPELGAPLPRVGSDPFFFGALHFGFLLSRPGAELRGHSAPVLTAKPLFLFLCVIISIKHPPDLSAWQIK